MDLWIQYNEICEFFHREEGEWSEWSAEYLFELLGASLTSSSTEQQEHFTVGFECVEGDTVYALVMIFSEGDSFGSAGGRGTILWVFKDLALAQDARKQWTKYSDEHQISIKIDNQKEKIKLYNPASDYFSHIEDLKIEAIKVTK